MMGRQLLASTLLVPALALGASVMAPAVAKAETDVAKCQVHSVLASKTGDGTIPDNLKFLADQLKSDSFAAYRSFRLLDTKQLTLEVEKPVSSVMKTGHKLTLNYLGADPANGNKLKLHFKLMTRDDTSLTEARLHIPDNGMVWIGGARHQDDKVFFALHCMHNKPVADKR